METHTLKQRAKDNLQGKWLMVVIGTIIYLFISGQMLSGSNTVEYSNGIEVQRNYMNIFQVILQGPATLGYFCFLIGIGKNEGEYGDLFIGFKRFLDTFLYNFITGLIIVIGLVFLIVPGIYFALTYSMGYLIMKDNPDVTATEAMTMSKTMMDGHKSEYFGFCLSFFGWFLLGIVTFGLGFLYLTPYFNTAKIEYYKSLKGENISQEKPFDDDDYYY